MTNSQVLQIPPGEGDIRHDIDLLAIDLADLHIVSQVPSTALDFDTVVQKLLERRKVENLVADRLAAVDGVLLCDLLSLDGLLGAAGLDGEEG